ncbi:MAG: polyprenol monophosphomannose synthase [Candidatus Rokuibacteriota bacterium]
MAPGDESLLVAIPTYNERDNIDALLTSLLRLHPTAHVVVIDDASPDGTGKLVAARAQEDSRIHLIERDRKSGIGSAYRTAFAWALEHGFALVVSMDADWSHDPREISRLLDAVEEADVVVGARYIPGGRIEGWPRSRLVLSRGANALAHLLVGRHLSDWTSGFKCYRTSALKALSFGSGGIEAEGYAFQVEILYHCHQAGFRICEIPIVFTERRQGRTKMSRAEVYRGVLTLLRIASRRLVGRAARRR